MTIKELKSLLRGKDEDLHIELETFCGTADEFSVEFDESYGVVVFKEF